MFLIVGVFNDQEVLEHHGNVPTCSHAERCEVLRHCRWVDEVNPDAPWCVSEEYLKQHRLDYIALEAGATVNPQFDTARIKGYDSIKALGECRYVLDVWL